MSSLLTIVLAAVFVSSVAAVAGFYLQLQLRRRSLEFFEEEYIPEEVGLELATGALVEAIVTEDISVSLFKPIATLRVIQSIELSPGETFELFARNTNIGRGEDNDILIPDRPVSRPHANLIFEEGGFHIFDVGSKFGTKVNGVPVPPEGVRLRDKDRIQLGTRTVLEFVQLEAERWPIGEETWGMESEEIESTEETQVMEELE